MKSVACGENAKCGIWGGEWECEREREKTEYPLRDRKNGKCDIWGRVRVSETLPGIGGSSLSMFRKSSMWLPPLKGGEATSSSKRIAPRGGVGGVGGVGGGVGGVGGGRGG